MDIEAKALALVNAEQAKSGCLPIGAYHGPCMKALCRAIEQHEAFRREVSDAVEDYCGYVPPDSPSHPITRFIIAKPDPLVEVMNAWWDADGYASIETFRAALAARGLEIVKKEPSND